MAFVITQPCIDTTDQACVEVCPVDCIHFEQGTDRMLYINPAECIDCGACQPACPVQAIFPEPDVPADMQRFIGINAAWYDDREAARAQVGGAPAGGGAPAPRPAPKAEAAPSAEPAAAEPAAMAPTAVTAARSSQVAAEEEQYQHAAVVVPQYPLPSPMAVATLFGMIAGFMVMFILPGPTLVTVAGWDIGIGTVAGLVVALFFLGGFVQSQVSDLSLFAAKRDRPAAAWRYGQTIWRRGEESRRYDQQRAVEAIAQTRFAFPTIEHPDYRTHVNVPDPDMALQLGGGAGEKLFPDILVVQYPGNYPVMVAQIETGETVTREQATRVWKQLETEDAPLYIYVPSGYGTAARDYAKAAGIAHAKIRTWAREPGGVLVHEL